MTHDEVRDQRKPGWSWFDDTLITKHGAEMGTTAVAVYMTLCIFANNETQKCYPSHQTIADMLGITRPTVKKYLERLRDMGWIEWDERHRENGGRTSNLYTLLPPPVKETYPPPVKEIDPPSVQEFDMNNTHDNKTHDNNSHGEPAPPTSLDGWLDLVRESKNRPATLRWMISVVYPYYKEEDLPNYGYIGKMARKVGGAGHLANLIWRNAEYAPQGNLMDYIQGAMKGKKNSRGREDRKPSFVDDRTPQEMEALREQMRARQGA